MPRPLLSPAQILVAIATAIALAGCASFRGGEASDGPRYEGTRQIDTLEVPPNLIGPATERAYRIPDSPGERISARDLERASGTERRTATGATAILPESPEVQLRRDGMNRWLAVETPPEALWPQLREFWRTQNLTLVRDEPLVGVMETEWSENRAGIPLGFTRGLLSRALGTLYDAGTRDQFRLRVERLNGTTDVFISHRGAVEQVDADGATSRWVIRDTDPALEAEMLNRLLVFLSTGEVTEGTMTAEDADDFERTGRVDLVERDGRPVLLVRGEPEALWRRLGLALDRTGLLVDEQDRSAGIFRVTYRPDVVEESQRAGLFSRIFGAGRGARGREGQRYQVQMIEDGRDLQIVAMTIDGGPLRTQDARYILEQIQPQLR